jgi:hypothetical protein
MKRRWRQPVRLVEQTADHLHGELALAQASMHAAASTMPRLSENAHRRIRRRLHFSIAGERAPRTRLWIAVAFGGAMTVSGVVGATVGSAVTSWLAQNRSAKEMPAQPRPTPERRRVRSSARSSSAPTLPEPPPPPAMPGAPAATVRPEVIEQARIGDAPPRPVAIPLPAPTRAPVRRHALASSVDVARPALPKPSPAIGPADQPKPSLGEAPSAMPAASPAIGLAGSLRHELRSVSVASGRAPERANASASPASPGRDEATILSEAIRQLRVQRNPQAALALLEGGGPLLMTGAFGPEVAALHIEVLLALGRTGTALDDLERLPIATLPRATEWLVVRAELRGRAGRWDAAEDDFASALATRYGSLKPELEERALWGRAVARLHRGNAAGARSDAEDYRHRFPHGRFRADADKAVAPSP